ncbi:unnamed protein product [Ilex paraguariensis]|uniref:Protein kinase domain-containing protein n=1 Tax=Ilex paraguariensis TaxID=185542 RepID=A0ABC8U9Y7_9AQUA
MDSISVDSQFFIFCIVALKSKLCSPFSGVVVAVCFMVTVGLICCFVRRRSNLKTRNRTKRQLCETGISIPLHPYKEIEKATDCFSDKRRLGSGAYGTGTPGYLDPQYHQNFHLSDKSDVYSFGVLLVEMITALKAVDFSRPPNEINLANLAIDKIGKGCLEEIIDPLLEPHTDAWTQSSIHKVAELAFRCLAFHRDMRPTMMEVAIELEQIRLCRWMSSEETITASSEASSCSSTSNLSEKPLGLKVEKPELKRGGLFDSGNSMDSVKDYSPVCVQDLWSSEQSSPSSNSLLSNVIE